MSSKGKVSLKPFLPKTGVQCRKCKLKIPNYQICTLCLLNYNNKLQLDLFEMLLFKLERIRSRLESIDNKSMWKGSAAL